MGALHVSVERMFVSLVRHYPTAALTVRMTKGGAALRCEAAKMF